MFFSWESFEFFFFDRVALRNDSYTLHKILPNKVKPNISRFQGFLFDSSISLFLKLSWNSWTRWTPWWAWWWWRRCQTPLMRWSVVSTSKSRRLKRYTFKKIYISHKSTMSCFLGDWAASETSWAVWRTWNRSAKRSAALRPPWHWWGLKIRYLNTEYWSQMFWIFLGNQISKHTEFWSQIYVSSGKTLLARAVAHHTECTFIRVSGSELVQKFIGKDIVVRIGIRKEAM